MKSKHTYSSSGGIRRNPDSVFQSEISETYDKLMAEWREKDKETGKVKGTAYWTYLDDMESRIGGLFKDGSAYTAVQVMKKIDIEKPDLYIVRDSLERLARKRLIYIVGSKTADGQTFPVYSSGTKKRAPI